MVPLQRAILFFERSGMANCCWKGYCRQRGGRFEVPGHPDEMWCLSFWTALNVHVLQEEGRYHLVAVENKLLDLGPMDHENPETGLPEWTEREALALLPKGALVLEFASDHARMLSSDGLPEEAWMDDERSELKPYEVEPASTPPCVTLVRKDRFRVVRQATAIDTYYVNADTPEEALELAQNPADTNWTDEKPPLVERIERFPPNAIVCPENVLTDAAGNPCPAWQEPAGVDPAGGR